MKTQAQVRKAFWESFPEFKSEYRSKKRQNDYNATIRTAFVDFVDQLMKSGEITEKQADNYTL